MSTVCEPLPWDSAFFDCPVARVAGGTMDSDRARRVLDWCRAEGTRFLYFLADHEASTWAVACDVGFRPIDIRVEMMLDRTWPKLPDAAAPAGVLLREATDDDLDALVPIAASVHTDSRFFTDPAVPREKAHKLFELWIRRSVQHAIADVVFVAEVDGRGVAYLSAKVTDGVGSIGLVGVGESARGRGVGLALVQTALRWFVARGAREINVVTQGRNILAQRVYQRSGFLTRSTRLWFHRWS
jgi:GNAT superfamily N-acetyltransferase